MGIRGLTGAASTCCLRCGKTLMTHHMSAPETCGQFAHPKLAKKAVKSAKVSPLNPLRWSLDLECGHEVWVTAKRKPTAKTADCGPCKDQFRNQKAKDPCTGCGEVHDASARCWTF